MPRYHIRCLHADGRVAHEFKLACKDDPEALKESESLCDASAVEIWDGSRLVARMEAKNPLPQ